MNGFKTAGDRIKAVFQRAVRPPVGLTCVPPEEYTFYERGSDAVTFARYETEFGLACIGCEDGKVVYLKFLREGEDRGEPNPLADMAFAQLREYLDGVRREFDFPMELRGTDFQKRVWRALCAIPYGETRTYKQIAEEVGNPKAFRAVGMANHDNPLWIAVPCHRVVGSGGKLTGYAGGLDMKAALLEMERKNAPAR